MKRKEINRGYKFFLSLFVISVLIIVSLAHSEDKFKLKEDAKGKICLSCHETLQETLKTRFVHPLLKTGECFGCHNPHTSSYDNLLITDVNKLCIGCHKGLIPEKAQSTHKVVVEGNCVDCHNPHASNNKFILIKAGNELCFDCHKDIGDLVKKAQFKHEPVEKEKGCLNCHNAHASVKFSSILKNDVPSLCVECHKTATPEFAKQHMNYPVANTNCSSCHNTHGSNKKKIIFDSVHAPVAEKKCAECHERPDSATPLKTKMAGVELCRECHKDMINEIFNKNRVHWPMVDKTGCLNCHSAHASKEKSLLEGTVINVCGKCHSDTIELQEISKNNPENENLCKPVKEGNCIICHSPHASDNILLSPQPSIGFDVCSTCHEWQTHKTHPIGEKILDQRNKNIAMDCLSCHKACGTGNKPAMMPFETVYALCVQCHVEYKR